MASFAGVRRSCRALQFILKATEAAIATQKPNGKPVSALTFTRQASFCQHGRSLPSPPEISAFYSRLNHAYMHPLTCVKYGAAALALGPAHSVTVPRGAASEYRICVSIIISAYGIYYLCAGLRPLYCMHYNYMYCLIASRGGNVLCTLSCV